MESRRAKKQGVQCTKNSTSRGGGKVQKPKSKKTILNIFESRIKIFHRGPRGSTILNYR